MKYFLEIHAWKKVKSKILKSEGYCILELQTQNQTIVISSNL